MIEHHLIRATALPEIIRTLSAYYAITEDEALKRFYQSRTAANYADEETGLYGQSPLHLTGMFICEQDSTIDTARLQAAQPSAAEAVEP